MKTTALVLAVFGGLLLLPGAATHASCRCRPVADYGPVWSPDDAAIAYTQAYEAARVVTLANGEDKATPAPTQNVVRSPDWRAAAAVVSTGNGYSLTVFSSDGTDVRTLDSAFPTPPAWSPDAGRLAYVGADEGLDVIGADGSGRHQIAAHVDPYATPSWSPDGSLLAFVSGNDVFVVPPAGGEARNITQKVDGRHVDPVWSPRGDAIAVVTDSGARFDIVGLDGTPRLDVVSQLPVAYSGVILSWSPRGDKLLYSHRFNPVPDSPGVYELDTATGAQRRISPFGIEASYSRDGSKIAFGGTVTIEPNPPNRLDCVGVGIWTVPSDGGRPALVTRTCTQTPPTLSIHAPPTIDYGMPMTISGGALQGFSPVVDITVRPCGRRASFRVAVAEDGVWSQRVSPSVTTSYTAASGTTEVSADVSVKPVVVLRQTSRLDFQVSVSAGRPLAGRFVNVQLTNDRTRKTALLRHVVLRRTTSAFTSVARFHLSPRELPAREESLSVSVPRRVTGPCLEPAISNVLPVSRP